jgi:hypothetical protein
MITQAAWLTKHALVGMRAQHHGSAVPDVAVDRSPISDDSQLIDRNWRSRRKAELGERFMYKPALIVGVLLASDVSSTSALAWCEADCVGLCGASARKGRFPSVSACIQANQCSKYAGGSCEPGRRAQRASALTPGKGGKCPRTNRPDIHDYVTCMAYNTKVGWTNAGDFCRRLCPGG